jgi:hypothetical protein
MNRSSWRLLAAGGLCVLALGGIWLSSREPAGEQSAFRQSRTDEGSAPAELQRAKELDVTRKAVLWTVQTRAALASDLIARRLTLFEAAAGFRFTAEIKDRYVAPVRRASPERTEEEQWCRQVIAYVAERLRGQPEQPAVLARLEKDLQEHQKQFGMVRLPEFRRRADLPWGDEQAGP